MIKLISRIILPRSVLITTIISYTNAWPSLVRNKYIINNYIEFGFCRHLIFFHYWTEAILAILRPVASISKLVLS